MRRAGRGDRGPTVLLVVQSVREYRARGASLSDLARALGVELMTLREWLDQHTAKSTRPTRPETAAHLWSPPVVRRPPLRGGGVLACTGDGRPGGNDLARELKIIRDRVQPRFMLTERTMIEVAELPGCVDAARHRSCTSLLTAGWRGLPVPGR